MTPLSNEEIEALNEALDDEYKSLVTYDQVIDGFGLIRPFINIRESESMHINALKQFYMDYGLERPTNRWRSFAPRFSSVESTCLAAVEAAIENTEPYDRIMQRTARPEILSVFRNLRDASLNRHLPAFRRRHRRIDSLST